MWFATRSCGNHGLRVDSVIKTTHLDVFVTSVARNGKVRGGWRGKGEVGQVLC